MPTTVPPVTIYGGEFPDPTDIATFAARAFPATIYLGETLPADLNLSIAGINDVVDLVTATDGNANYKGLWSSLTGALAIPASVFHDGQFWTLTEDLADVTASEPGVDPEWQSPFISTTLTDYGVRYVNKGNSGSGTVTVNWNDGNVQRIVATDDFTLAFSNITPTGIYGELQIEAEDWGAHTVTFPTVNWVQDDGSVTTSFATYGAALQSSGVDFIVFWTRDGGTTLYGKVVR